MSSKPEKITRLPSYLAIGLLWLASAGLGLAAVYYFHALSILLYSLLGGNAYWVGNLIGQVTALVGGVAWLATIIITGEYHLKHAGEGKSWKIAAYVLGIELVIVIVGMIATGAM